MAETRRFAGHATRSQLKVLNNLGIVSRNTAQIQKTLRNPDLDLFDAYFEGRQYEGMVPWNQSIDGEGSFVPTRDRQPKLQFNFAKVMSSRLASKLVGRRNFPKIQVEDDEQATELIRLVHDASGLRHALIEPTKRALNTGSTLIRFSIQNGFFQIEHYLSKWCFPEFNERQELTFVKIQYVFKDEEDRDERGMPKKKWFRLDLGPNTDILYDNPEFSSGEEPEFTPVETAEHNLGFVQAEWMVTSDDPNSIDGPSLIEDIMGFIDELNYSISKSSDASEYNQDPQLVLSGLDEDEIDELIRSSAKAWNLGKDGKAELLEAQMGGMEAAQDYRDKVRLGIQDLARVVLLDPEKVVGHAQSAKAMEVLHGPMVELIEELQPFIEKTIKNMTLKMMFAVLVQSGRGAQTQIVVPSSFKLKSTQITASWPPIFPPTMDDLDKKVTIGTKAASGNIISRETITKWLAKDFGVEDVEEELRKIESQPILNPFGSF